MNLKRELELRKFRHRMKKNHSVESAVVLETKNRKSWENGITFRNLVLNVNKRLIRTRKKDYTEGRIREAISLIQRYGREYSIYIKSDFGWVKSEGTKRIEYRYFTPLEQYDVDREHQKHKNITEVCELKDNNLSHHETVTIPQEQRLEELRQ